MFKKSEFKGKIGYIFKFLYYISLYTMPSLSFFLSKSFMDILFFVYKIN